MNALLEAAFRLYGLEERVGARARRWRVRTSLLILAWSAAVLALVLLAISLYLFAATTMPPWQAAALAGVAALAVAGVLVLSAHWLHRRRTRLASHRARTDTKRATEAALDELLRGGSLHASDLVVTTLVAGIVLGASPALRGELAAWLRPRHKRAASDRHNEP